MLNMTFSSAGAGSLRMQREKLGIDGEKIAFAELSLSIGDLSEPFEIKSRKEVYNAYFKLASMVKREIRRMERTAKHERDICMWYSKSDIDEYIGMLAAVDRFYHKGKNVYVCDCTAICRSLFELQYADSFEIPERRQLSDKELQGLICEWREIQAENAPYRIMKNGNVTGVPMNFADDDIFSIIGDKEVKVNSICGKLLSGGKQYKLLFIMLRIRQLIAEGKITVVSEEYAPRNAYYGTPMKDFGRNTIKQNKQKNL